MTQKVSDVALTVQRWGILNMIDFSKDLYYTVSYPHKTQSITILIWISLMLSITISVCTISVMSMHDYIREFGLFDFEDSKLVKERDEMKKQHDVIEREVFESS